MVTMRGVDARGSGGPAKKLKVGEQEDSARGKGGGVEGKRSGKESVEGQSGGKLSPGEDAAANGGSAGGTASGGGLGAFGSKSVREAVKEKGKKQRLVVVVYNMRESKSGGLTCTVMDFCGTGEAYTLVGTKESLEEWEGKGIKDANVVELKNVDVWCGGGGRPVVTFSRGEKIGSLGVFTGSMQRLAQNAGPRHWSGVEVFQGEGRRFVACVVCRLERVEEDGSNLKVWLAGSGGEVGVVVERKRAGFKDYLVSLEGKVVELWGVEKTGEMSGVTQGWDYLIRVLPTGKETEGKYREMEEWMGGGGKEDEDDITRALRAELGGE